MRILRSQYLQLRQNVTETNNFKSIIGQKVPSKRKNNDRQYNSYSPFDENNNNNTELTTLTQTSTITTTTTKIRRNSLILSNNEATNCLFSTPTDASKIDDLFGFNGFPETEITQTTTPVPLKRRRQTLASCSQQSHSMQIQFCNVPETVRKINVTVQFTDLGSLWLTRIYQSYENDLWQKRPRIYESSKTKRFKAKNKWFYDCLLCLKQYCGYASLKSHLNQHLELYPYNCKLCSIQYTNRRALTKHLRSIHHVERDDWNEYIG